MTSTQDRHPMAESIAQIGLRAFGSPEKPAAHAICMGRALSAIGVVPEDFRVQAGVRAYRKHYDPDQPLTTVRLALEAAVDAMPGDPVEETRPVRTGRKAAVTAVSLNFDGLEPDALAQAIEDFGHTRLELDTSYLFHRSYNRDEHWDRAFIPQGAKYVYRAIITVHELAADA